MQRYYGKAKRVNTYIDEAWNSSQAQRLPNLPTTDLHLGTLFNTNIAIPNIYYKSDIISTILKYVNNTWLFVQYIIQRSVGRKQTDHHQIRRLVAAGQHWLHVRVGEYPASQIIKQEMIKNNKI